MGRSQQHVVFNFLQHTRIHCIDYGYFTVLDMACVDCGVVLHCCNWNANRLWSHDFIFNLLFSLFLSSNGQLLIGESEHERTVLNYILYYVCFSYSYNSYESVRESETLSFLDSLLVKEGLNCFIVISTSHYVCLTAPQKMFFFCICFLLCRDWLTAFWSELLTNRRAGGGIFLANPSPRNSIQVEEKYAIVKRRVITIDWDRNFPERSNFLN